MGVHAPSFSSLWLNPCSSPGLLVLSFLNFCLKLGHDHFHLLPEVFSDLPSALDDSGTTDCRESPGGQMLVLDRLPPLEIRKLSRIFILKDFLRLCVGASLSTTVDDAATTSGTVATSRKRSRMASASLVRSDQPGVWKATSYGRPVPGAGEETFILTAQMLLSS